MAFKIALTNVDFDNRYINVMHFNNLAEQEAYFNLNTLFVNAPIVNLNIANYFSTRFTLNNVGQIFSAMNYNYCIVKNDDDSDETPPKYLYYFINKSTYLSANQVAYDVELDIFNTYYLHISFSDCIITRCHLNRFIEKDAENVAFDGGVNSKLFEREPIQDISKRLTARYVLPLKVDPDNSAPINQWLNANVAGWYYYYLTDNKYKFYDTDGAEVVDNIRAMAVNDFNSKKIYEPLVAICVPIYKANNRIRLRSQNNSSNEIIISNIGWDYFKLNNNNNTNVYSAKFSILPPMDFKSQTNYEIIDNDIVFYGHYPTTYYGSTTNIAGIKTYAGDSIGVLVGGACQVGSYLQSNYVISNRFEFTKEEIINAEASTIFNPKLLSSDYAALKVTNERGEGFEYDIQKINKNNIDIKYTEALTPDVTRSYTRVSNLDGIYINETDQNLTGFVDSADMSLMVDNDKLSEMLASNKNFYLQNVIGIGKSAVGGAIGGAIAGKGMAGIVTGVASGTGAAMDLYMSIDNMRSAPNMIKNANGNAIFNTMYTTPGVTIEEYNILENEKEMINNFMMLNGFSYGKLDNIKNVDNIRKYYNFVSANVENVSSYVPLSNEIRAKFVEVFARGVRFWNLTEYIFTYSKENYERWLEDEQI